jgi:uncharacterized protein (DUF433 family)
MLGRVLRFAIARWRLLFGRGWKGYRSPVTDAELISRHIVVARDRPMIVDSGYEVAVVVSHLVRCGWEVKKTREALPDLAPDQIRAARAYAVSDGGNDVSSIARRHLLARLLGRTSQATT